MIGTSSEAQNGSWHRLVHGVKGYGLCLVWISHTTCKVHIHVNVYSWKDLQVGGWNPRWRPHGTTDPVGAKTVHHKSNLQ